MMISFHARVIVTVRALEFQSTRAPRVCATVLMGISVRPLCRNGGASVAICLPSTNIRISAGAAAAVLARAAVDKENRVTIMRIAEIKRFFISRSVLSNILGVRIALCRRAFGFFPPILSSGRGYYKELFIRPASVR